MLEFDLGKDLDHLVDCSTTNALRMEGERMHISRCTKGSRCIASECSTSTNKLWENVMGNKSIDLKQVELSWSLF